MKPLHLTIPTHRPHRYPIIVAAGSLAEIPQLIAKVPGVDRCIVLYDKRVEDIANQIADSLEEAALIAVPSGEESKSLQQVERITQDLLLKKATRRSVLICVGGGMLTDLGGFVASVFMRGIKHIHVPTSLLGMVDASIGGKTGVDLGLVKNMVGTIHHPVGIVVDTDVLASLPDEQLREGLVEVVKMAATLDAEFFGWLEENVDRILDREADAVSVCIQNAARMKVEVVEKDEREDHHRMLLNFGHTVSHAVEALSQFAISHGKAVSIGMVCEMEIAQTEGRERVVRLLERLDMPLEIPAEYANEALWEVMRNDKKVAAGEVRIAVPPRLGEGVVQPLSFEQFCAARS